MDRNSHKTHCKRGHPYDEANTRRHWNGIGWSRVCITCNRERQRKGARRVVPERG